MGGGEWCMLVGTAVQGSRPDIGEAQIGTGSLCVCVMCVRVCACVCDVCVCVRCVCMCV